MEFITLEKALSEYGDMNVELFLVCYDGIVFRNDILGLEVLVSLNTLEKHNIILAPNYPYKVKMLRFDGLRAIHKNSNSVYVYEKD